MNSSFDPAVGFLIDARPRKFPWVNVALFLATCFTTLGVGAFLAAAFSGSPIQSLEVIWSQPSILLTGLPFCIAVMSILFAHEMGHYLTCRHYGIDATLPYFIPIPFPPFGTMGAFIKIRSRIYDRGSLLDVGVAGPIAGFVVAVVALVVSLGHGRFVEVSGSADLEIMGDPLILTMAQYLMGLTPPAGMDVFLSPVSFAAWFGFLVTALNLLPAAQLDGGHIAYAIFGRWHRWISRGVVCALVPLAIFYWFGWFVWILLLLLIKLHHPPTVDDSIPLKGRQIVLGWIGLALFVLCFIPAPFKL